MFAAQRDETRLRLIGRLAAGSPQSIARLTATTRLTRQAVTKHLRVLEGAGMTRASRSGRESLFTPAPRPIDDARDYLAQMSRHWDDALTRLEAMGERE